MQSTRHRIPISQFYIPRYSSQQNFTTFQSKKQLQSNNQVYQGILEIPYKAQQADQMVKKKTLILFLKRKFHNLRSNNLKQISQTIEEGKRKFQGMMEKELSRRGQGSLLKLMHKQLQSKQIDYLSELKIKHNKQKRILRSCKQMSCPLLLKQ